MGRFLCPKRVNGCIPNMIIFLVMFACYLSPWGACGRPARGPTRDRRLPRAARHRGKRFGASARVERGHHMATAAAPARPG